MKKQVVIVRGGETFDTYEEYLTFLRDCTVDLKKFGVKRWKENLEENLGSDFQVIILPMVNTWNAKYAEWKIYFDKLVPQFNDEVILVGNSLGTIFLVKYLSENIIPKKILTLFLVGACHDRAKRDYSLADFTVPNNLDKLTSQCSRINFYFSSDDPVVLLSNMDEYKKSLPTANYSVLDNRGHFSVTEFPEIVEDIKKVIK